MRQTLFGTLGALMLVACGGGAPEAQSPADASSADSANSASAAESASDSGATSGQPGAEGSGDREFKINDSSTAGAAHGATESKIKATATEAAMKFFVVDKGNDDAPMPGIVIAMTSKADGKTYYTEETDSTGYAEVLVPVGQQYELVYLSLGRKDINAKVKIEDKPNQNIKLTLRYKKNIPMRKVKKPGGGQGLEPAGFVLNGVTFDTGKATIRPESYERLESVIEYMTHKKSARIEISGHTDNVGNPGSNKTLSTKRAEAVRDYLVTKGIEKSRIEAVGYGEEKPVESNDTEEGRQANRRIEAVEL